MEKKFVIDGWSYPYKNAVHIILKSDDGKFISRTYERKGCFFNFMMKHGLLDSYFEIARYIWG